MNLGRAIYDPMFERDLRRIGRQRIIAAIAAALAFTALAMTVYVIALRKRIRDLERQVSDLRVVEFPVIVERGVIAEWVDEPHESPEVHYESEAETVAYIK